MRKNYFFVKMLLFLFVLFAWLSVTNKAVFAENVPANELSLANSPLNSVASWESNVKLMGNYFYVKLDPKAIQKNNKNCVKDISGATVGSPYYFFGKNSKGQYLNKDIGLCIDIFHLFLFQKPDQIYYSNITDYIKAPAAQHLTEDLHMGAMLAQESGMKIAPDKSTMVPLLFDDPITQKGYDQRAYMFSAQMIAWQLAAANSKDYQYCLPNLTMKDFNPYGTRSLTSNYKPVDMSKYINDIENLDTRYHDTSYIPTEVINAQVGQPINLLNIPSEQQVFIHSVNQAESTNLNTLEGLSKADFTNFTDLTVVPKQSAVGKKVEIVVNKTTSDFWNSDLGYTGLYEDNNQYKGLFSMPEKYVIKKKIILNIVEPPKKEIQGEKIWHDYENKFETRPDAITVHLYQNNQLYESQIVKEVAGHWLYHFVDLPVKDEQGIDYVYTVKEETVDDYTTIVGDGVITNTYVNDEKINLSGKKIWQDYDDKFQTRPTKITVHLYQNNNEIAKQDITADESSNWNYHFNDLAKYDENGNLYNYTVKEDPIENYTTTIDGTTITNTYQNKELTAINGEKIWQDENDKYHKRPEMITVRLLQNGTEIAQMKVKADETGHWLYQFDNLAKYDENGELYRYTVKEDPVADYETIIDGTTITNSYNSKGLLPDTGGNRRAVIILSGFLILVVACMFSGLLYVARKKELK